MTAREQMEKCKQEIYQWAIAGWTLTGLLVGMSLAFGGALLLHVEKGMALGAVAASPLGAVLAGVWAAVAGRRSEWVRQAGIWLVVAISLLLSVGVLILKLALLMNS